MTKFQNMNDFNHRVVQSKAQWLFEQGEINSKYFEYVQIFSAMSGNVQSTANIIGFSAEELEDSLVDMCAFYDRLNKPLEESTGNVKNMSDIISSSEVDELRDQSAEGAATTSNKESLILPDFVRIVTDLKRTQMEMYDLKLELSKLQSEHEKVVAYKQARLLALKANEYWKNLDHATEDFESAFKTMIALDKQASDKLEELLSSV